jgi:hypothetical protein
MKYRIVIIFSAIILATADIAAQTGGDFTITQSVVASGGGQNSAGGFFTVDGTIGQPIAGGALRNPPFTITSGFWNFSPLLAPTAANVSVGGRITTSGGSGVRNVRVTLTAPDGQTRTAQTGSFGYYRFEAVPVGETYIISVISRRFTFSQPTQVVAVLDAVADINFIADEL